MPIDNKPPQFIIDLPKDDERFLEELGRREADTFLHIVTAAGTRMIPLTSEESDRLDKIAQKARVSRSQLMRLFIQ